MCCEFDHLHPNQKHKIVFENKSAGRLVCYHMSSFEVLQGSPFKGAGMMSSSRTWAACQPMNGPIHLTDVEWVPARVFWLLCIWCAQSMTERNGKPHSATPTTNAAVLPWGRCRPSRRPQSGCPDPVSTSTSLQSMDPNSLSRAWTQPVSKENLPYAKFASCVQGVTQKYHWTYARNT